MVRQVRTWQFLIGQSVGVQEENDEPERAGVEMVILQLNKLILYKLLISLNMSN